MDKPKRLVFLGQKKIGFLCLQFLVAQQQNLQIEIIAADISSGNTALQTSGVANDLQSLCKVNQIPIINHPNQIPETDYIISVQYHRILNQTHIDKAKKLALNLHLAPLPEYRGCNQFSFAIIDQATEFGVTLHQLETGIDAGAIIAESRFTIPQNCWVTTLYDLSFNAGIALFETTMPSILSGNYKLTPQHLLVEQRSTTYHHRHEIEQLKQIDLNWEVEKIERHIRATYFPPFEPPYALIAGQKVYFTTNAPQ